MSIPGVPGGGGGLSASSSASTGPQRSGDIGGSNFSFGGIQTGGSQGSASTWVIVAGIAAAAVLLLMVLRR